MDVENHPFDGEAPGEDTAFMPRYEGRGVLGEGGMGEVRLYFDARMGREVAMKVLLPRCAHSRELRARFEREALVQGRLEHPAVVPVYEKGLTSAGLPWFTMKRIRGETLEEIIPRLAAGDAQTLQRFPRHRLLRAFAQACRAVDFAHSRGVIHCDLKPSNLMLGDFGEVYVLDWGLAQWCGTEPASADVELPPLPEMSAPGRLLGTPGYVAPEQAKRGTEAAPSADVYSLGAILFEILMHERLVERGPLKAQLDAARAGTRAAARLSARRDTIPADLAEVCANAARRTVAARPSAGALAETVELYLAGDERAEELVERSMEHVRRAQEAARRAREGDDPYGQEHRRAIHESINALRLDANNIAAAENLAGLMVDPPRVLPFEARRTLEEETSRWVRDGLWSGALGRLSWIFYVPLVMWAGLKDGWLLAALLTSAALGAVAQLWARRRPTPSRVDLAAVISVLSIAPTAMVLGPLWVTPIVVLASVPAMIAFAGPRRRLLVLAAGVLTVALPALLEWRGWLPATYAFRNGELVVRSQLMQLEPAATLLFVLILSLGALVTSVILVGRARDLFMHSTARHHLELWQLAQLIPGIRAKDIGRRKHS
ncbi:MAG: protein kinase [Deltaproteobacteria bacterium]|nr:protein kinase [Deltaproteobacteria bacterium]